MFGSLSSQREFLMSHDASCLTTSAGIGQHNVTFWYLESRHNFFLESLLCFSEMWQVLMMITGVWGLPCFLCIHDYSLYANFIAFPHLKAAGVAVSHRKEEACKLTENQRLENPKQDLRRHLLFREGRYTWNGHVSYQSYIVSDRALIRFQPVFCST